MKKIILMVLITFIGIFAFNLNVEALNSDASATCVYTIPNNETFKSATFVYENVDLSKSCSTFPNGLINKYTCNIDGGIVKDHFVDSKTGKVKCPTLYYSYQSVSVGTSGATVENIFTISAKKISSTVTSKTGQMTLSSSKLNQGSKEISENEESKYLQCLCGDVLMKQGSLSFGSPFSAYQKKYNWSNFNLNSFTECPEAIYYKLTDINIFDPSKSILTVSNAEFSGSQALACGTTEDAAGWGGSSGSNTDYKPQEDVILSFCSETSRIWKMVGYLVNALKVLVPVIIIVMGSIDLGKAVVANSEDEIKKGTQLLVKRIIAGVIIFFIPTIINLILKMASNYVSTISSSSSCIECVTTPWGC